MVLIEILSS